MTSEDSNSLQIHSKVDFIQLQSSEFLEFRNRSKFFTQSKAEEARGHSILSKSIIRHQDQLVEVSIIDLSHLHSLQTRCETHVKVLNLSTPFCNPTSVNNKIDRNRWRLALLAPPPRPKTEAFKMPKIDSGPNLYENCKK